MLERAVCRVRSVRMVCVADFGQAQYFPGLTINMLPRSRELPHFPLQNLYPREKNNISRRLGNPAECDEAAAQCHKKKFQQCLYQ